MNKRILAGCVLAAAAITGQAQVKTSQDMGHGVGVLDSGVTLKYKTVLEPPMNHSTFVTMGGAFGVTGDTMHHCIYDRAAQSYFGYDLTIGPGDSANSRKIVFGPLNLGRMRESLNAVAGDLPLNPAPLPKYPPPQTIFSGDTIAMDLMVSPDGHQRIVDYIQFSFGQNAPKPPKADTATPLDFTLDDGPLHVDLMEPEVWLDDRKFDGHVITYASKGGATAWIYLPGRGRYLLSLAPHEGFIKAGAVRGRKLSFATDGHECEIRLNEPVAGTDKAWNLYVRRDPAYLPLPAIVNSVVMGSDRLENLMQSRER